MENPIFLMNDLLGEPPLFLENNLREKTQIENNVDPKDLQGQETTFEFNAFFRF